MDLNLDEIMNYMKYITLNTNRKYQEIQIENMFTEEQKIWIVKEMAASRSPITMKRSFFKKFAVKGRKNMIIRIANSKTGEFYRSCGSSLANQSTPKNLLKTKLWPAI